MQGNEMAMASARSGRARWARTAGALAWLALAAIAGCGDDASRLQAHLERGEKYLEEKQYPEAILEFKNMLQIDPNQAKAHYGLARAYLGSKQAQRAFWELQETVRLDPEHADARLEYAQFLLLGKKEELEEAIKQADAVLAKKPDLLSGLLLKGRALQTLERFDEASAVYEHAMQTAPSEGAPILLLATLQRSRGELERAEELFRKLAEVSPGFASYAALAGFLAGDPARDAETEKLYREALERAQEAEKPAAYAALANFYYARERWDDTESLLRTGIETVGDDLELVYTLARFYHARGDTQRADEMIQQATQAKPDDPKPFLVLSAYRGRNGDLPGALAAAEDALKADPEDLAARLRRAELLVDIGFRSQDKVKIAEGRAAVTKVLAGDAANPEALFVQSKIELAEGQPENAVTSLRRAIDKRPGWPQAHMLLGSALFLRKDLPGARAELARALELDAGLVDAAKLLSRVHAALGDDDLALEVGRKVLAAEEPGNEDVKLRILLAQSLARQRRLDDAARELSAIPAEKRDAEAWYALGRVELLRGNLEPGRAHLLRAQELDATRYEVLRALLDLDVKQGRLADSAQRIGAALKSKPDDPKLVQLDGEVALYSGDQATAEARFKRAIDLDPNDLAGYEKLARYMMVTGRPDEVVKTYETALEKNPDQATLHLTLGSLFELQGHADKAIARYEDAVRLDPKLAVAKNNLAYLIAETGGSLDRALDLAQEAKEMLPDNPNAADTLGWVLYKKNSHDAAIGYLREAVRNMEPDDPQLPIVRQHLALAYEASGDLKSAREAVDQALADIEARRTRDGGGEAAPEPAWAGEIRALQERLARAGS
jgi:tetratricopeptide (TPR) repeat protein